MFSYIRWNILALDGLQATVLVEGTGLWLEVWGSPLLISHLRIADTAEIWLHHHITDVGETLFGFVDMDEKSLFRQLLRVNGVWGKTALQLLGLGADTLMRAIGLEDDMILSSVPGIGKKTAQKIIVDLKGSIDFSKKVSKTPEKNTTDMTLIASLVQMGYDKSRVESVVREIDAREPLEIRTIDAIKRLSQ